MLDILLIILENLAGDSIFYIPILMLLLVIGIVGTLHKKYRYPRYILRAVVIAVVSVFVAYFAWICMQSMQNLSMLLYWVSAADIRRVEMMLYGLLLAAGIVLIAVVAHAMHVYIGFHRKLKRTIRYTKKENYDYSLIEAWYTLSGLPPSKLTKRQRRKYEQYRIYLRMLLGNFNGIDDELEKRKEEDKAYYHFLKYVQCNAMGHMEDAARQIQMAEENSNADTEPLIRGQIMLDRGVGYVGIGLYEAADDAFVRAIQYCSRHRIKEKTIWETLYYNYVFNQTRLHPQMERKQWEQLLEPLKSYLDMKNPKDYMAFSNIELELLRQTNGDRHEIGDNIYHSFAYLMQSDIPIPNRCMVESSFARMIWSAQLNPTDVLRAMNDDLKYFFDLPMPARYNCFKQIDIFFADLHGGIVKEYDRIKQSAFWYMMNQAQQDLEDYRRSLPAEAVYERCFCLTELAGRHKKNPEKYQWDTVIEWLENAIALYHENGLEIEEIMCELAIMDEAMSPLNMDGDYRITKQECMNTMLDKIEKVIPRFEKHPVMAEIAIRLSFYSCAMHDYGRCKKYYEIYWRLSEIVPIRHFASWMHRYYMVVCFTVRILYFLDVVNEIRSEQGDMVLETLAEQWFAQFYERNGAYESFVLAMVLGLEQPVLLKMRRWPLEEGETFCRCAEGIGEHLWLILPQIGMEVDVTYSQFVDDAEKDRIVFNLDHHPLQLNRSNYLKKKKLDSMPLFNGTYIQEVHMEQFSQNQQDALQEVYHRIIAKLPKECPPIPVLSELYGNTMLPVNAGE